MVSELLAYEDHTEFGPSAQQKSMRKRDIVAPRSTLKHGGLYQRSRIPRRGTPRGGQSDKKSTKRALLATGEIDLGPPLRSRANAPQEMGAAMAPTARGTARPTCGSASARKTRRSRRRSRAYSSRIPIWAEEPLRRVQSVASVGCQAGECLFDEILGRAHDYTLKTGVVNSEIGSIEDTAPIFRPGAVIRITYCLREFDALKAAS